MLGRKKQTNRKKGLSQILEGFERNLAELGELSLADKEKEESNNALISSLAEENDKLQAERKRCDNIIDNFKKLIEAPE